MKVLIFDDDVFDRRTDYFFPPSLEIAIYDRADQCLPLIASFAPDIVLMDFHMRTGYKGEQAVADIRRVYAPEQLPIIGISSMPDLNRRMTQVGASRAVRKSQLQSLLFELASTE